MPIMNFDLEDGLPPVSFSINGEGAERMMNFMSECQQDRDARAMLVAELEQLRAEKAESEEGESNWRRLALQFDGHRVQALGHLRALMLNFHAHYAEANKFISAAPLDGEAVLARRIAEIAAASAKPVEQEPIREALQVMVDRFGPCEQDYIFSKRAAIQKARAALAAAPQAPQAAPAGWKLVPIEPTIEMIAALGWGGDEVLAVGHALISQGIANDYAAMLAAAPEVQS